MKHAPIYAALVLALGVVWFSRPSAEAQQVPPAQRWEYAELRITFEDKGTDAKLWSTTGSTSERDLLAKIKANDLNLQGRYSAVLLNAAASDGWEPLGGWPHIETLSAQPRIETQSFLLRRPAK